MRPFGNTALEPKHAIPPTPEVAFPFVSHEDLQFFNEFDLFGSILNGRLLENVDSSGVFWRVQELKETFLSELTKGIYTPTSPGRTYEVFCGIEKVGRLEVGPLEYSKLNQTRVLIKLEQPLRFDLGELRNFFFEVQVLATNPDYYDEKRSPRGLRSNWNDQDRHVLAVVQDILWDHAASGRKDNGKYLAVRFAGSCEYYLSLRQNPTGA